MPTLSALFTKFVLRQTLVSAERESIRADIEAGHAIYKTTAQWVGVTLADKAIGIETDSTPRKLKIGDGVTVWASLAYAGGGQASDLAYDATAWNGNTDAPTKNAVRDKLESLVADIAGKASTAQGAKADAAVLFTAQTLDAGQKTQARGNIGVDVPETTASILTKIQAFDTTQEGLARVAIGSEHLTRTVAEGVPVSGVAAFTSKVVTVLPPNGSELYFAGRLYTMRSLNSGLGVDEVFRGGSPDDTANNLLAAINAPSIGTPNADVVALKTSTATLKITARLIGTAGNSLIALSDNGYFSGNASLSGGINLSPTPTHLGQWCRFGDAAPFDWYQANTLTSWVFRFTDGESGAVEADSILTALGALDSTQILSLRAILSGAAVSLNPLP